MSFSGSIRLYEQTALFDEVSETIRPGGKALTSHALAFCNLPDGAYVLDVGCGQGASVEHLITHHHAAAFGLDPSALLLRAAHQRRRMLPLMQAQGENLPVGTMQLDAVVAECSLSVMEHPNQALSEFWRVLRIDGCLILSDVYARDTAGADALSRLPIASCLRGALSRSEVTARVKAAGFAIRLWEDHTAALKAFAAQLIWRHGSMQQFWCRAASSANVSDIEAAVRQAKPGYYLLIGQKETRTFTSTGRQGF